jgi:hypothetical protein
MEQQPTRRSLVTAVGVATIAGTLPRRARSAGTAAEPAYLTAGELLQALADRQTSARELTDATIGRIEALDAKINAVVARDFDRARQAAVVADALLAKGERRPLLGLPMTVKEQFNIAGLPTTWGHAKYKGWKPEADALAVQRLKAAGAIILGKTNTPVDLADWQSYNDVYGTTNNPWDLTRTPGGSSGGSPGMCHWSLARTSSVRSVARRISVASSRTSRASTWCRSAAPDGRRRRPFRCAATCRLSDRWPTMPASSHCNCRSSPDRTS